MRRRGSFGVSRPTMEQLEQERRRIRHETEYRKALTGTINVLIVVAAIAVLVSTLVFPVLQIAGDSMVPTLENGDIILLLKTRDYETGDLCSFTWNNRTLIKRVIAGPGQWVEISQEGVVTVDGQALEEPYIQEQSLGECDLTFPYQVPEDCYFLMGDHRATSIDSRVSLIGSVHEDQIIGKILLRLWPFDSFGLIE